MYFFGKTTPDERDATRRFLSLTAATLEGGATRLELAVQNADIKQNLTSVPQQQQQQSQLSYSPLVPKRAPLSL